MTDGNTTADTPLAAELEALVAGARREAGDDPFGNPIGRVALALTRRLDRGENSADDLFAAVGAIGRAALADRAERLAAYVGLNPGPDPFSSLAERLAGEADTFEAFRDRVERTRYGAVFTAHPTFGMRRELALALAALASEGTPLPPGPIDFRPDRLVTLRDEFEQARHAVRHARDALDGLNRALLEAARRRWPERWTELVPRPLLLASWVGCDTDGRQDIGWWDSIGYRLESKSGNYARILERLPEGVASAGLRERVETALAAVQRQLALVPPTGHEPSLDALQLFAQAIVGERDAAIPESGPLLAEIGAALGRAQDDEARIALCLVRAGCAAHGVSLALPHVRLNASQLHNALRARVTLDGEPAQPAQRRAFLAAVNAALGEVEPVPVDFGGLAAERSSATRLVMTVAQIVKHLDGSRPVRFLIAETETGYTLLAALWLARRFGIADRVEISPLFETAEALEQGPRILEEALRSRHWRDYLRAQGRLCLQFGYSDSGRYVGQLSATFWVERMRLRLAEILGRHGLGQVEVVLFDTHGDSVGRGAHPDGLADRLLYLAPARTREAFRAAGIPVVRETSFQGTDGYLLFGTRALAEATVARIAEDVFAPVGADPDPIYDEPDFAAEFFGTVRQDVEALVDDPGYAALIGTFGPSLLDKTGSRPAARQGEGGGPARIRHPRELRAIPNNAILHQLGWLANTVHGLGHGAARAPDLFRSMRERSDRFERAFRLAERALASSDLDVLRAYLDTLDPGSWFDRARRTDGPGRRAELLAVGAALQRLDLAPVLRRLFGRLATDAMLLREVAGTLPAMTDRLAALHAIRLAAIGRIWLLATRIPDFRPQDGVTRDGLIERILRLDVPGALATLAVTFPLRPDPTLGLDFGEPPTPREDRTYAALHEELFAPMGRMFELARQVSGVIQHEVGAFG